MSSLTNVVSFGLFVWCLQGCSDDSASPSDSNAAASCSIEKTTLLVDLTTSEIRALCDCNASIWGGYGQTRTCENEAVAKGPADQSTCIAEEAGINSACTATVEDVEECTLALKEHCSAAGSACQALIPCYASK